MKRVILSQRAYLSMLAEVYERVETETGGIFLGHRDGDTWYVLESIEPGPKSVFTPTYFEYDDAYVTYRANKIQRLYKCSIDLLGLWHRHPSLMKTFSSTDDGTNKTYSDMLGGAISGIVTLGNGFEITMYYVPSNVQYERIEWVVDDELIPKEFLSYYDINYYEQLINETVGRNYVNSNYIHSGDSQYKESDYLNVNKKKVRGSDSRNDNSCDSEYNGIIGIIGIIVSWLSGIWNIFTYNEEDDEDDEYIEEDNDIASMFDTIEPEIAYLQKLGTNGNVSFLLESKKDSNGKDGLILNVKDNRQEEEYHYKFIFFVSEDKIWVKDENGNIRPYSDNFISTFLGGRHD